MTNNSPKKFNKNLYLNYDQEAKDSFINYLKTRGATKFRTDPFGKYGIDISCVYNDLTLYFDVEVRPIWKDNYFPFDTIHLPFRKKKFIDKTGTDNTHFIAFRGDYKSFVWMSGWTVNESPVVEVENKYKDKGEHFYDVDINKCKVVNI